MKVKELEELFNSEIRIYLKNKTVRVMLTNEYDDCEIKAIEIDDDDTSLAVWLKDKKL